MKFPYVYPDPESRRLRAALAEDSGLEDKYILVGCGADELIDLIMRSDWNCLFYCFSPVCLFANFHEISCFHPQMCSGARR